MDATTKQAKILLMCSKLMKDVGKDYLYISQSKMLELLEKYQGYRIKRRQLCYRLAELKRNGYMERTKRNKRLPDGRIIPMTSLTFLTHKAYKLLARLFNGVSRALGRFKRQPTFKAPEPERLKGISRARLEAQAVIRAFEDKYCPQE